MKSESCRWLTAVTLLFLAYPATLASTLAVERPCNPTSVPGPCATKSTANEPESTAGVTAAMAQLPLSFEPNVGQTDSQVEFLVRGAGYGAFLTEEELVLSLPRASHDATASKNGFDPEEASSHQHEPAAETLPPSVVRMRLTGADFSTPVGELPLEAKTNYFLGNDPSAWHTDVPNFARVRYTDVYPGVDLVYYGNGRSLEYDFVVAPGANPDVVAMEWEGAESVEVDENGTLVMKVESGELRQASPVVYQDGDEGRSPVSGAFEVIGAGRVGVRLGAYDSAKPLVIDPVLVYSTFRGGNGWEGFRALAVDTAGSAYVTGFTFSTNFPTTFPYDSTYNGGWDVLVAKLSPSGNALVYSTYLGGDGRDFAWGLAVDSSGAVYVSGETDSDNFPTAYAYDTNFNGGTSDAFVTKLTSSGNALNYSTYLGGSGMDESWAIAVDSHGSAYVTGRTNSPNFPTVHAFNATPGILEAFVTKLRPLSNVHPFLVLEYSTYLGGNGGDSGRDIVVDASGAAYVVGDTKSTNFPVWRAFDSRNNGGDDGFVTKLSADGGSLLFSTYFGGTEAEHAFGVTLASDGTLYVTGQTLSTDFPTTQLCFDPTSNGGSDAFVTKWSPGSVFGPAYSIDFSTFLGGSDWESGNEVVVTFDGSVLVAGGTSSADFPTADAYDSTFNGDEDVFVTKLSADGTSLIFSTFFGGRYWDFGSTMAVDSLGIAYVAGDTSSSSFPTTSGYDSTYNGGGVDGFILRVR